MKVNSVLCRASPILTFPVLEQLPGESLKWTVRFWRLQSENEVVLHNTMVFFFQGFFFYFFNFLFPTENLICITPYRLKSQLSLLDLLGDSLRQFIVLGYECKISMHHLLSGFTHMNLCLEQLLSELFRETADCHLYNGVCGVMGCWLDGC